MEKIYEMDYNLQLYTNGIEINHGINLRSFEEKIGILLLPVFPTYNYSGCLLQN